MIEFFKKKISVADLAQTLAMQLHENLGETEDLARDAFAHLGVLDGLGFDAAMEQVRFAQVEGLCMGASRTIDRSALLNKAKAAIVDSCEEVGYLREHERELFGPHAVLYERVYNQNATGDWERDCAVLGLQFADFLVADRNPVLVELGTKLFHLSNELVASAVFRRKVI